MQVPPSVSTHHADAVDKAVAALRYGSVNINVATMLGFCVPKLTWGAYPGNTPQACHSLACLCLALICAAGQIWKQCHIPGSGYEYTCRF